jgi:hypothetical protein
MTEPVPPIVRSKCESLGRFLSVGFSWHSLSSGGRLKSRERIGEGRVIDPALSRAYPRFTGKLRCYYSQVGSHALTDADRLKPRTTFLDPEAGRHRCRSPFLAAGRAALRECLGISSLLPIAGAGKRHDAFSVNVKAAGVSEVLAAAHAGEAIENGHFERQRGNAHLAHDIVASADLLACQVVYVGAREMLFQDDAAGIPLLDVEGINGVDGRRV